MSRKKDGFVGNRDSGKGDRQLDARVPESVVADNWVATYGERVSTPGRHVYKYCKICEQTHVVKDTPCEPSYR